MLTLIGVINLQGTKQKNISTSNRSKKDISKNFIGVMIDNKAITVQDIIRWFNRVLAKIKLNNVPLLALNKTKAIYTNSDGLLSIFLVEGNLYRPLIRQLGLNVNSKYLFTLFIVILGIVLEGLPQDEEFSEDYKKITAEINNLFDSYIAYISRNEKIISKEKLQELLTNYFIKLSKSERIKLIINGKEINKDLLTKPLFIEIMLTFIYIYVKNLIHINIFSKIDMDDKNKQEKKDDSVFNGEGEEDEPKL